jgi:serine/threonine-protein kinase
MGEARAGAHTGETLGSYQLQQLVGTGGGAEVYSARDTMLDREVAVKVLLPELSEDAEFIRRFRGEARRVAALRHPHVMPVYQYGEERNCLYLVMPLLSGGSLRERLRRERRLEPEEAVRIALQIAAALDAAHATQLVHRDVKPENILFDTQGEALLTDFGLARDIPPLQLPGETWLRHNTTGIFGIPVGTPEYMAPEQFHRIATLDQRVDIYSLGVVLYEMLTGRVPFTGTPIELAERATARVCPPPSARNPDVWPELDDCIMRALAVHPDDRYGTAADFATALYEAGRANLGFGANLPMVIEQPTAPALAQPSWPLALPLPGHPPEGALRWALAAACAALLLVAGGGLALLIFHDHGNSLPAIAVFGPAPSPTATPTDTPTPSATPTDTQPITQPSATAVASPTATDTPTATPTPTPTPSPTPTPLGNSATFLSLDTTTQGTWMGTYGADGYDAFEDSQGNQPAAYAKVTRSTGTSDYTWASSTTDKRALQRPESPTNRIAACWYSGSQFSIYVTISDGQVHPMALYFLDWDSYHGRTENVELIDPTTTRVLDQRAMTAFTQGKYLVWSVSGTVTIQIINTNSATNAVVSGIFFG